MRKKTGDKCVFVLSEKQVFKMKIGWNDYITFQKMLFVLPLQHKTLYIRT